MLLGELLLGLAELLVEAAYAQLLVGVVGFGWSAVGGGRRRSRTDEWRL
jgi:hypothetical protein